MECKSSNEIQADNMIPAPTDYEIECLQYLLHKMSSMTDDRSYSNWDRHLRYEFGDERTQDLIDYLKKHWAIEVEK